MANLYPTDDVYFMNKLHISQLIVVEGKYDKIHLESIVDALIIACSGFSVYKNHDFLRLLRDFSAGPGVIIATDSDHAGFQIRRYLRDAASGGKIYNLYIPDIVGKEKRKVHGSKEGKLGLEGMPVSVLLETLLSLDLEEDSSERRQFLTKNDMLDDGLVAGTGSAARRKQLKKALNLPENLSTDAFIKVVNASITPEEYRAAVLSLADGGAERRF